MNKKNALVRVLAVLFFGLILLFWQKRTYWPDIPRGLIYDGSTYLIDPDTFFLTIGQEEAEVFIPAPPEPEEGWPEVKSSGSTNWSQEDYFDVTDALHKHIWGESLEEWRLVRAYFWINQCQSIYNQIDSAKFSFFKSQGGDNVHSFWINPSRGFVVAGSEFSRDSSWQNNWKRHTIELSEVQMNDVATVLTVAEENGGRIARQLVNNQCRITILLAPDSIKYDILTRPFSRYGWGWNVIYRPNEANTESIFEITIDPYTGKYRIP